MIQACFEYLENKAAWTFLPFLRIAIRQIGRPDKRGLLASSALTRKKLGWIPNGPGLISDLEQVDYSQVA